MILASKYARENDIAYFGMGMGMYAMAVDILRENGIEAIKDDSISKASLLNNDMVYAPRENGEKDDRRVGKFDLRIREGSTLREILQAIEQRRHLVGELRVVVDPVDQSVLYRHPLPRPPSVNVKSFDQPRQGAAPVDRHQARAQPH